MGRRGEEEGNPQPTSLKHLEQEADWVYLIVREGLWRERGRLKTSKQAHSMSYLGSSVFNGAYENVASIQRLRLGTYRESPDLEQEGQKGTRNSYKQMIVFVRLRALLLRRRILLAPCLCDAASLSPLLLLLLLLYTRSSASLSSFSQWVTEAAAAAIFF